MKLKYHIPFIGNYFLYNDIIKNQKPNDKKVEFHSYIKFDLMDYFPIIGVRRLRYKISLLDKKIVWFEQVLDTTLQVWDCKMDKMYKHISNNNKE
jgi:hypothetical protein